jgi:hypothetical protein
VSPDTDVLGAMTFSDSAKIGLTADRVAISLKVSADGARIEYPKNTAGIYCTTPAVGGDLIRQYEFAQFDTVEPTDPTLNDPTLDPNPAEVTDVRGRLHDGTTEFWYTAGVWTAITDPDTDWNTLEEVSTNLPAWDASQPLGFVFELSTKDGTVSPLFRGVRVLYEVDLVSFHNDWLYTTLIAEMTSTIRPRADLIVRSDGTVTVDLGAVEDALESAWDVVDVDAVFDEDSDPAHRTDLLSSYDTGTRLITLTGAPAPDTRLLIRFTYKPVVAVTTDHDFTELGASPAVLFESVDVEDRGEAPESDNIVNVFSDPPMGVILPAPRRTHMTITLNITAPGAVNMRRLAEAVTIFLQDRRTITSPTDGRRARVRITDPFNSPPLPDQTGLHSATMEFRLENVYVWLRRAIEATGVRQGGLIILTDIGPAQIATPVGG